MLRPCPRLKELTKKDGRLQREDEAEWQSDLKRYEECREKQAALANHVARRDAALTGVPLRAPRKAKRVRTRPAAVRAVPKKVESNEPAIILKPPTPNPDTTAPIMPAQPRPKLGPTGDPLQ